MAKTILLVGEGDFSFSASLSAHNSSLERSHPSSELPLELFATALLKDREPSDREKVNIEAVIANGGKVLLDVDATKLEQHSEVTSHTFCRVLFNFPHVGGKMNIKANRHLLCLFFQSCQCLVEQGCLDPINGQVWVTLCAGQGGTPAESQKKRRNWHDTWQIVPIAADAAFALVEVRPFTSENHRGYHCTGYRSQEKGFRIEGSLTHIFEPEPVFHLRPTEGINSCRSVELRDGTFLMPSYCASMMERNNFERENSPIQKVLLDLEASLPETMTTNDPLKIFNQEVLLNLSTSPIRDKLVIISNESNGQKFCLPPSPVVFFPDLTLGDNNCRRVKALTFLKGDVKNKFSPVRHMWWITWNKDSTRMCPRTLVTSLLLATSLKEIFMDSKKENIEEHLEATIQLLYQQVQLNNSKMDINLLYCKYIGDCMRTINFGVIANVIDVDDKVHHHLFVCLDNLAMAKYGLHNWHILWSDKGRFSNYNLHYSARCLFTTRYSHDISFWLPSDRPFRERCLLNFLLMLLGEALVAVDLLDDFRDPTCDRHSLCYRLTYQSWAAPMSKQVCLKVHAQIRQLLASQFGIEPR